MPMILVVLCHVLPKGRIHYAFTHVYEASSNLVASIMLRRHVACATCDLCVYRQLHALQLSSTDACVDGGVCAHYVGQQPHPAQHKRLFVCVSVDVFTVVYFWSRQHLSACFSLHNTRSEAVAVGRVGRMASLLRLLGWPVRGHRAHILHILCERAGMGRAVAGECVW
jgi:hypothetical protein